LFDRRFYRWVVASTSRRTKLNGNLQLVRRGLAELEHGPDPAYEGPEELPDELP